jgi:hypothetical protein
MTARLRTTARDGHHVGDEIERGLANNIQP